MPRRSTFSTYKLAAVVLAATGCGFEPSGLGDDPDDAAVVDAADGGGGSDGLDGAAIDAPVIDARAIDASPDAGPACPTGYVALGTSTTRYRLIETTMTWAAAAADCNDDDDAGGFSKFTHLGVIGDEAERLAVTGSTGFTGNRWVGLEDMESDNVFRWVTAEPTGGYPVVGQEPPWDGGDPDGQLAENCVRFKNSFGFEDKDCLDTNKVLCECDDFPPR